MIALRSQIVDYDLIVIPGGKYLSLTAVITEAEYIADVLAFHHSGLANTTYRLLNLP